MILGCSRDFTLLASYHCRGFRKCGGIYFRLLGRKTRRTPIYYPIWQIYFLSIQTFRTGGLLVSKVWELGNVFWKNDAVYSYVYFLAGWHYKNERQKIYPLYLPWLCTLEHWINSDWVQAGGTLGNGPGLYSSCRICCFVNRHGLDRTLRISKHIENKIHVKRHIPRFLHIRIERRISI